MTQPTFDARRLLYALIAVLASAFCMVSCSSESDLTIRDFHLSTPDSKSVISVRLPGHLDDIVPSESGKYTLFSEVVLPQEMRGHDIEMGVACGSALWSLFVSNEPMPLVVHDDLLERYRTNGPRAFYIPARLTSQSMLELRMEVSHTWTQSAWFDCPVTLATKPPGLLCARVVDRLNKASMWMALVTLSVLAIYLLLLWRGNQKMRFAGLFAVQLAGAILLPVHQLGLMQPLFGTQDTAVLGLSLAAAIVVSVYSTNLQYGLPAPGWIWKGILGVNVVATVAAGGPFGATPVLAPVVVVTLLFGLSRNVAMCARMLKKKEHSKVATMSILAWASLLVGAGLDFVPWMQGGEIFLGLRLAPLGLTLYAGFLFLGMGTEYLRALERSDELNKQLQQQLETAEKSQREIEKLNDELRRQVAERSRQLLAALLPVDESNIAVSKLSVGELIEGRYKITREIASGGMGQVFEAVRQDDGRVLAIKVSLELDTNARARIVREAQVASRIVHPNLVSVMDVGVASTGYVYLVMEYVDGTTLDRWQQRFGDVDWGLKILTQVCRALSALHSAGLVHRDLKPANVLLTLQGGDPSKPPTVKIGDFGISKSHHQRLGGSEPPPRRSASDVPAERRSGESTISMKSAVRRGNPAAIRRKSTNDDDMFDRLDDPQEEIPDLTAAGVVLGTPMYVAPELASPWAEVTPAADMYAFGVLVFNVLGRATPFQQPLFYLTRAGQAPPPPCSIATVCPSLPQSLVEAFDACLAAEPSKRPSARRMGEIIDRVLDAQSTSTEAELS